MRVRGMCRRAVDLLSCERARRHGDMRSLHACIAAMSSAHLGYLLTPKDVALMVLLLRVARIAGATFSPANYVDAAGYAGIADEFAGDV